MAETAPQPWVREDGRGQRSCVQAEARLASGLTGLLQSPLGEKLTLEGAGDLECGSGCRC